MIRMIPESRGGVGLTCCCNETEVMGDSRMVDKCISDHDDGSFTDQGMLEEYSGWNLLGSVGDARINTLLTCDHVLS